MPQLNCNALTFEALQGATNSEHNIQVYANKYVVHTKFLEAVQSFVCQNNMFLLTFAYFDPAFLIGRNLFYLCIYFIPLL